MSEQWLSIVEYARKFSISDMTVRRRIKTGKLRAILKEGKYYIPGSESYNQSYEEPHRPADQRSAAWSGDVAYRGSHRPRDFGQIPIESPSMTRTAPDFVKKREEGFPTSPQPLYQETSSANDFFETCEKILVRLEGSEQTLQQKYEEKNNVWAEKVDKLENVIKLDQEKINQLNQKVEDLQLLVRLIEKQDQRSQ